MKLLLMIALLALFAFPALAQDSGCEIDLSQIEALLEQAEAEDDPVAALALLQEAKDAITTVQHDCLALIPVTLGGVFAAPDEFLSFEYPDQWIIGEYDTLGSESRIIFMGSSESAIEQVGSSDEPDMRSGQQIVAILAGNPEELLGNDDEVTDLEDALDEFSDEIEDEFSDVSSVEYFTLNDRRAGAVTFGGDTFAALMIVVEYQRGQQYAVLIGITAPDEDRILSPVVRAIAETLRVEN